MANRDMHQGGPQARQQSPVKWSRPEGNFLKCNWDAAIDLAGKRMGVGVLRDSVGEVAAAKCLTKQYITDPLFAEMVAAWSAAHLIRQLNIDQIILEGDSLGVVRCLTEEGNAGGLMGPLVEDIKHILVSAMNGKFAMFVGGPTRQQTD
ncbi:uncharacterized protein LOC132162809 [Corylus avellana]|uniref:uncharacterized protein LOC132162809 n=1 Tax=Corylus avellana TaxID=13451 RepID=UPI00286C30CF|nr:uncharacterized protein LOC132162809 [Corylus avellana]